MRVHLILGLGLALGGLAVGTAVVALPDSTEAHGASAHPTGPPTEEPTDPPTEEPTEPPTEPPLEYCTAEYTVIEETDDEFEAEVEVTAGADGVDGWMVDWVFANRQEILSMTGATWVNHGAHFEATNVEDNGVLEPGETASFAFTASYENVNIEPRVECQEA